MAKRGTAATQAGSSVGLQVQVQGTSCLYDGSRRTAGAAGRRLQSATSTLAQAITGTDTSGDARVTDEEARALADIVMNVTGSDRAKAKLLGDAVETPGYDATQMTAEIQVVRAVSNLPSLPPHTGVAPRYLAGGWLQFRAFGSPCAAPAAR
jgi:hypothetical protein